MTKFAIYVCAIALAVAAFSGCNTLATVPHLSNLAIDPADLHPGDEAIITVKVQDKQGIVDRVEGVVKEDTRYTFRLRDDGVKRDDSPEWDEVAGDGIWSMRVNVPFQTPPGEFELEFTAYSEDGHPVQIRDDAGNVLPLSARLPFVIRYAE